MAGLARLVLRPVFRVGKVPPLEVGAKQVDQILSQATQVRDDGDGLPATAVVVKTQAVLASAEWGTTCDWVAVVHEDVQVSAARADGHGRVVPEGLDGLLQRGAWDVGMGSRAGLRVVIAVGPFTRPEQGPWRGQLATGSR